MIQSNRRHIVFIENRNTSKLSPTIYLDLRLKLKRANISFDFHSTDNLGDLRQIINNSIEKRFEEFVAIGGDGSIHHLVNCLIYSSSETQPNFKLAIIPNGTGNDYIKNFGFKNLHTIIDSIIQGSYSQVDIGEIQVEGSEKKHFINMLGIGFSAEVVKRIPKYRCIGKLAYYLGLIEAFFFYKPSEIQIQINGQTIIKKCFQLSIGIGKYAGGGMKLCPQAKVNDGLFEINIIESVSLWKLIGYIHTLSNGTYLKHLPCTSIQSNSIQFLENYKMESEADGELLTRQIKKIVSQSKVVQFFT